MGIEGIIEQINGLLKEGRLPLAEIYCRNYLKLYPKDPVLFYFLGIIAQCINLPHFAEKYFVIAANLNSNWELPRAKLRELKLSSLNQEIATDKSAPKDQPKRFILIKAWGYGFWSDVDHVLGQLLIAEITNRIPVIHWGSNSKFGDGTDSNAFDNYFEPVSDINIDDLISDDYDFFPSKWNRHNLKQENINKYFGPYARMAGMYFLNRPERVVVSDFTSRIIDLIPWIPSNNYLYGHSIDELYSIFLQKYLRPKKEIMDQVTDFVTKKLYPASFMAVHFRGTDKVQELGLSNFNEIKKIYFSIVDRCISAYPDHRIFLMTDDLNILDEFSFRYKERIVVTDSHRSKESIGLHNQDNLDRCELGREIMVDTYIAAQGDVLIGCGWSNPSLMISYLKNWDQAKVHLIGQNAHHNLIPSLYM